MYLPIPCMFNSFFVCHETLLQHPFDIRGAVENLASQLDVGNPSLIAIILQTPATDLQPLRKLLVRIEALALQRGFALRE